MGVWRSAAHRGTAAVARLRMTRGRRTGRGSADRHGGSFGGAEARDVGRGPSFGRERSGAGKGPRRAEVGGGAGGSGGGHEESIPAGSAVRGRAPRANVSVMRMRPPQQGQILDALRLRRGSGAGRSVACVGSGQRPSGRVGGRDQVPQAPDGCGASGAGEEAVVADAVEAARQDVEEEASDELAGRQRHRLDQASPDALAAARWSFQRKVTPASSRRIRREFENRDAVSVAGQVGQDGLRSRERPLGVDDPFRSAQRRERGVKGGFVGEPREVAEEDEAAGRMQGGEVVEEEPAEETRQHPNWQEEAGLQRSSENRPATGRRRER